MKQEHMVGWVMPATFDRRLTLRTYQETDAVCTPCGDGEAISCTVMDFSDSGARIRFEGASEIPKTFVLWMPKKGMRYTAEVMRIEGDEIGVRFTSVNLAVLD